MRKDLRIKLFNGKEIEFNKEDLAVKYLKKGMYSKS